MTYGERALNSLRSVGDSASIVRDGDVSSPPFVSYTRIRNLNDIKRNTQLMKLYGQVVLALTSVAQLFVEERHVFLVLLQLSLQHVQTSTRHQLQLDERVHQLATRGQLRAPLRTFRRKQT